MLDEGFGITQVSVLNTAGSVDIAHKGYFTVTIVDEVIRKLIGGIEAVSDYAALGGELIVKIEEHHWDTRIEDGSDVFIGYLPEDYYAVNTLMKENVGEHRFFLIYRGEGVEKGVMLTLLEGCGYAPHKLKVKRIFGHISFCHDYADISAEGLFLFRFRTIFIAHCFGGLENFSSELRTYSTLTRKGFGHGHHAYAELCGYITHCNVFCQAVQLLHSR